MPGRILRRTIILLVVLIPIILAAGCLLRPEAIYPSIQPVEVQGGTYRDIGLSFSFEGVERSISIPVNGTVYYGAQQADKDAILSHDLPDSVFIPAYYLAFLDDPNQDEFFRDLTGAFRDLRAGDSLDDDEYLELMTVAVQSMPYDTGGTLTPPKFPIETYVDGRGDCDDKSLLLAGLLSREGYSVALFYFKPETHMAIGVKGGSCDYQGTGYGYVETTNLSFVGVPTTQLAGGVNLTSIPLVIPVGNGTRLYGECQETMAIEDAMERARAQADSLSGDLTALSQRLDDLRSQGNVAGYNQLAGQYRAEVEAYDSNTGTYDYIIEHQDDRKGTYAWLKARALV